MLSRWVTHLGVSENEVIFGCNDAIVCIEDSRWMVHNASWQEWGCADVEPVGALLVICVRKNDQLLLRQIQYVKNPNCIAAVEIAESKAGPAQMLPTA